MGSASGSTRRFSREFYQVALRRKIYRTIEELQEDLDAWMAEYNHLRPHQGKSCDGKTPYATFTESKVIATEKQLTA